MFAKILLVFLTLGASASAAVWQWSAPVASVISDETKDHPRAYLWIPENCQQVRGVVLGQHNMLEEGVLEHPVFRKTLSEVGFAEIWVTPAFNPFFRFDQGAGDQFQEMMTALAKESGYSELETAPVIPIGHSAMAGFPYHFAAWNPGRTLAAISLKGTWPDARDANSPPWKDADLKDVPLLFVSGEYEWADERAGKALAFRKNNPGSPLTMLADPGGGHFDIHDDLVEYLGFYVKKVAEHRLPERTPASGEVKLKPVDPEREGWLVDRWRQNDKALAEPASVKDYAGKKDEAFWCFDKEQAFATEAFGKAQHLKKPQLAGYRQDGQLVPQDKETHQQVTLPFKPIGDGLTFKLEGCFLDAVPDGRPVRWTGLGVNSPVTHATGPVVISRICGPVEKLSDDTFALRFDRLDFNSTKRSNEIWLMAVHPGDGEYKRCVQQSVLHFPLRNTAGEDQTLEFQEIKDQRAGAKPLKLHARSSAKDAEVRFYVREGPAEINGDALIFTRIPPRAKYPVKVTVVAWQWGRSIEPKLKTAEPVERTFLIAR
ncbi:MAG: hypothetical protein ABIS50_09125 [Luteolibacter sp.]|uniref:hypothetical protein n=1 Tax=Luteolibacter sp. TaxID=1962973 RepID=UPI0032640FE0